MVHWGVLCVALELIEFFTNKLIMDREEDNVHFVQILMSNLKMTAMQIHNGVLILSKMLLIA